MRLFKCEAKGMTLELVDLPRSDWKYLPPSKWQVIATLAGIVITAIVWAVL